MFYSFSASSMFYLIEDLYVSVDLLELDYD